MGCDIHAYIEIFFQNEWHLVEESPGKPFLIINYRNYDLFAILADVRNGRGFAGISTGEGFIPISPPRGIPEDTSNAYKALVDDYGADGHSHSWLTLEEILHFDWTQTTKKTGVLDIESWQGWSKWDKHRGEAPDSYSSDIWGPGIEICHASSITPTCTHVRDEWTTTYARAASLFWVEDIPKLLSFGHPTKTRLVFFFDN